MSKRRTEEEKGRMQSLRNEGKTYKEIAQIMNISVDAVNYFFRKQYRDLHKSNPEKYPARKRGRQPHPELTRKELEQQIKDLKKELKLYKDFLYFAGRM